MDQANISEAVLFLNDKGVSKEMLFPEFESVLDNVVGLGDCKNQEMRAVFVRITAHHTVTTTVFFLIKFDNYGVADPDWNVPLRNLADSRLYHGPDLGAGPVNLVCRSQCSIQWLQDKLWDPEMTDECNHFAYIRDAVKRNRLGLLYIAPEADVPGMPAMEQKGSATPKVQVALDVVQKRAGFDGQFLQQLTQVFEKDLEKKVNELEHNQKLYLTTLETKHKQELDKIHGDHQSDLRTLKNQISQLKELAEQEKNRFEKIVHTLEDQLHQVQHQREQLEENLNVSAKDKQKLEAFKHQYEAEIQAKFEAERTDLLEQLEMREVELLYRQQQEAQFKTQLEKVRQDKITLLGEGADRYLERLHKSGIVFVSYQAGSGHLTIPLSQMGRYIDDPIAYVAEKNGLTVEHYQAWLTHYNNPVCVAKSSNGQRCNVTLKHVLSPKEFVDGNHNYCIAHRLRDEVSA